MTEKWYSKMHSIIWKEYEDAVSEALSQRIEKLENLSNEYVASNRKYKDGEIVLYSGIKCKVERATHELRGVGYVLTNLGDDSEINYGYPIMGEEISPIKA